MKNSNPSQAKQILEYLQQGRKLTAIEALQRFGCFRLSARIYEIRENGVDVKSQFLDSDKKRFKVYFL